MLLSELLKEIEYSGQPDLDTEITAVVSNSAKIIPGCLFVCIRGARFDGHTKAAEALDSGVAAVVCQQTMGLRNEIIVKDSRYILGPLCAAFYHHPDRKMKLVAVTGTNGKTTVTGLIHGLLSASGNKAGLIGTVEVKIGDVSIPSKYTTPEPVDLYALLSRMAENGCRYAVMEASSQAIHQQRLSGLYFDVCVFTNLTQDHLDYHGTMENYYQAKKSMFFHSGHNIINIDNEYGRRLVYELDSAVTLSVDGYADFMAGDIKSIAYGSRFNVIHDGEKYAVSFGMPGKYSVENALCALAALDGLGFPLAAVSSMLYNLPDIRGRSEIIYSGDFTVITDFAHTDDALDNLLSSLKKTCTGRLITLFGCAGDRDAAKRPKMAEAACRYSDIIIITSDNPRTEDPKNIINDVLPYIKASGIEYYTDIDRVTAVKKALSLARRDDIVALCGKGHEIYQVLNGYTVYCDERKIVKDIFNMQ